MCMRVGRMGPVKRGWTGEVWFARWDELKRLCAAVHHLVMFSRHAESLLNGCTRHCSKGKGSRRNCPGREGIGDSIARPQVETCGWAALCDQSFLECVFAVPGRADDGQIRSAPFWRWSVRLEHCPSRIPVVVPSPTTCNGLNTYADRIQRGPKK